MKRFLQSPFDRAMLLMLSGQVLVLLWLGPDIRAHPVGGQRWGIAAFLISIGLTLYSLLESLLEDSP